MAPVRPKAPSRVLMTCGNVGIRLVWRVLCHWTEITDGGAPDEVDAQAGAVRPRVPERPECGAAAIRASYSAKTAPVIGHENIPRHDFAAAIEKALAERAERAELRPSQRARATVCFGSSVPL